MRNQRDSGVETDMGFAGDIGVLGEARIGPGVGHDKNIVLLAADRVGAKRDVARSFPVLQSHSRLEPLPGLIDERDRRYRGVADLRGELNQVIIFLFRRRVQDLVAVQGCEPPGLIGGDWIGEAQSHAPTCNRLSVASITGQTFVAP